MGARYSNNTRRGLVEVSWVIVDVEAGPAVGSGDLQEFGAVEYKSMLTFHGRDASRQTFERFDGWLKEVCKGSRPVFWSDNPAYDWQWINHYFHRHLGHNPFGWSARRIGDFYAGLVGNPNETQRWKRLRITAHDHNPVHDALGNAEALHRLIAGER